MVAITVAPNVTGKFYDAVSNDAKWYLTCNKPTDILRLCPSVYSPTTTNGLREVFWFIYFHVTSHRISNEVNMNSIDGGLIYFWIWKHKTQLLFAGRWHVKFRGVPDCLCITVMLRGGNSLDCCCCSSDTVSVYRNSNEWNTRHW